MQVGSVSLALQLSFRLWVLHQSPLLRLEVESDLLSEKMHLQLVLDRPHPRDRKSPFILSVNIDSIDTRGSLPYTVASFGQFVHKVRL